MFVDDSAIYLRHKKAVGKPGRHSKVEAHPDLSVLILQQALAAVW